MIASRHGPLAAGLLVVGAVALWYGVARWPGPMANDTDAGDNPVPRVQVITASLGPKTQALSLPGTVRAWYAAPIYAQVSGYVTSWDRDYGAPVRAGDRLATIAAPGLDQQYATARADLDAAQDRYAVADLAATRWKALSGTQAVSRQEVDVQVATAAAEAAQVEAAQHEVARLQAMERFKTVAAPFDGVVTARNTDVGAYVNAAGGDPAARGASGALFTVSDIHKLRIFVSVPQDSSAMLKPGLVATMDLPQYPGRQFTASLTTTARSFDPVTRTVIVELLVENAQHLIWPGAYADVQFIEPTDPDVMIVPQQSLLFGAEGMQLAVLDDRDRVHLRTFRLRRDLGQMVQIDGGIGLHDRLVDNPSAGLFDGEQVMVTQAPTASVEKPAATFAPKATDAAQSARIEAARNGASD